MVKLTDDFVVKLKKDSGRSLLVWSMRPPRKEGTVATKQRFDASQVGKNGHSVFPVVVFEHANLVANMTTQLIGIVHSRTSSTAPVFESWGSRIEIATAQRHRVD